MARLHVDGRTLVLRLNPIERLLALRPRNIRMPVQAVLSVRVVDRPWRSVELNRDLTFGFAGNGAPGRKLITASTSARRLDGARAAVFLYVGRPSVRVDLDEGRSPLGLVLVSSRSAHDVADQIERARSR